MKSTQMISADQIDTKAFADSIVRTANNYGGLRIGYIPLPLLTVNGKYQRKPEGTVYKIADNFDIDRCGILTVSYDEKSGDFKIVDGQHRYLAARKANIGSLPCQILMEKTPSQEAMIFATQNDNTVRVSPYDKLRARIFAGDQAALAFQALCAEFNVEVLRESAKKRNNPYIYSVTVTENIFRMDHGKTLRSVFEVIRDANWHDVEGAYRAIPIRVLKSVIVAHKEENIKPKLAEILKGTTPLMLQSRALAKYENRSAQSAMVAYLEELLKNN